MQMNFVKKLIEWVDVIGRLREVLSEQTETEIRPKSDFIKYFSSNAQEEIS